MNTTSNPAVTVSSNPKRIILASAYRHERHSSDRQERALKALHKMGRFNDDEMIYNRLPRRVSSEDETLDE